jgi:hypothetical protein
MFGPRKIWQPWFWMVSILPPKNVHKYIRSFFYAQKKEFGIFQCWKKAEQESRVSDVWVIRSTMTGPTIGRCVHQLVARLKTGSRNPEKLVKKVEAANSDLAVETWQIWVQKKDQWTISKSGIERCIHARWNHFEEWQRKMDSCSMEPYRRVA